MPTLNKTQTIFVLTNQWKAKFKNYSWSHFYTSQTVKGYIQNLLVNFFDLLIASMAVEPFWSVYSWRIYVIGRFNFHFYASQSEEGYIQNLFVNSDLLIASIYINMHQFYFRLWTPWRENEIVRLTCPPVAPVTKIVMTIPLLLNTHVATHCVIHASYNSSERAKPQCVPCVGKNVG